MPLMKTDSATKHHLPSTAEAPIEEQVFVKLRDRFLLSTMELMATGETDTEMAINAMVEYITEWNYTDETGAMIPITQESIRQLDWTDFLFIKEKMTAHLTKDSQGLDSDEKKTSIDTSKELITLTPPQ